MAQEIIYVDCPKCGGRFYIHQEFLVVPEAYCYCPHCAHEFVPPKLAQRTANK